MSPYPVTLWVNIHAVVMLALPVLAIAFLWVMPKRRPRVKAVTGWTLLCVVVVGFLCMPCLCMEGPPFLQVVVPMACLWVLALWIKDDSRRVGAVLVCASATFVLSQQYEFWAHHHDWTSAPKARPVYERVRGENAVRDAEEVLLAAAEADTRVYPAMWWTDLPVVQQALNDKENSSLRCPPKSVWEPCWHSYFTRLYCRHEISQQDFWYLGGPLKESRGRIVIMPRP